MIEINDNYDAEFEIIAAIAEIEMIEALAEINK